MPDVTPDIPRDIVDTSLLASLIIEFNISHRFFKAYPAGHPVVTASLIKVISRYEQLLEHHDEISIAVAKDALIVENDFLDKSSTIFSNFAGTLFERGIGALILRHGLTIEELIIFNKILGLNREEIALRGGIEALWEKEHLSFLGIRAIRYDLFSATEGDVRNDGRTVKGLWERFARGLINGTLGYELFGDTSFDPEQLAEMLNRRYREVGADYVEDVAQLLQQPETRPDGSRRSKVPYEQIAAFVAHLNPELRQHFLSASFDIRTIEGNSVAEEIVGCMPAHKALETLEEFKRSNADIPASIVQLLEKLANSSGNPRRSEAINLLQQDPYEAKMRLIFSEHGIEEQLASTMPRHPLPPASPGVQTGSGLSEADMLMSSLEPLMVENRIGEIILRLAATGNDPSDMETLAQNLAEMCSLLLQTGDYHQLHAFIRQTSDPSLPVPFRALLAEWFSQNDFLDEILDGLTIWGKSRFQDIRLLIEEIGAPFIEPLLDKLAIEENMSLRRFIMDRLQEFGPSARKPILSRLKDNRWYYLRNLLIMLNSFGDPELAPHIRPLLKHNNSKVRQDALLSLLQYHDPVAVRQLVRDLGSANNEVKLAAISMAKKCHSTDVFRELLAIVSKSGLSPFDVEFKIAAINSLKEMGRAEALPVLVALLNSSNLLRAKALAKLKMEAVRSLESYPPQAVLPILVKIAGGNDELARQAGELQRAIRMKNNGP